MVKVTPQALPPREAIAFFELKGFKFGFNWRDVWDEEHTRAFTVAKAMQLDLLAQIREGVDSALAQGLTLDQFIKDLRPYLKKRGWWGVKDQVNPATGEVVRSRLGSPHRLRVIYETNLRTAHAVGRWQRIQRRKETHPYLRLSAILDSRTRDDHRAYHGIVLPVDDPFWDSHYPPNGFGCRCKVQQLSERDIERRGYKVDKSPRLRARQWRNRRTGRTINKLDGVDEGWAYNVGKASRQFDPRTWEGVPLLEPGASYESEKLRSFRNVQGLPKATANMMATRRTLQEAGKSERGASAQVLLETRKALGVPPGKSEARIKDFEGVEVIVNDQSLDHILGKNDGREAYTKLAREAIENPLEVWLAPFRKRGGRVVIRKRYIGAVIPGKQVMVVVERTKEGFVLWTAHPRRESDSYRKGYLVYSALKK
ncbi:MAG: phage minor head protein [Pseudomonadota bacterium]